MPRIRSGFTSLVGDDVPVYCYRCGAHLSGPEREEGKDSPEASGGLCLSCFRSERLRGLERLDRSVPCLSADRERRTVVSILQIGAAALLVLGLLSLGLGAGLAAAGILWLGSFVCSVLAWQTAHEGEGLEQ